MVRFHASNMILALHSETSHLSEPGSKSRAAGHFYLTTKGTQDLDSGTILTLSRIITHAIGSAGESDMVSLYYNCSPIKKYSEENGPQATSNKSHN